MADVPATRADSDLLITATGLVAPVVPAKQVQAARGQTTMTAPISCGGAELTAMCSGPLSRRCGADGTRRA
jgi:hypothetical protein